MSDDRTMSARVDALWCSLDDQLAHHSDDDPPSMAMCWIALEAAGLPDLLTERDELFEQGKRFVGERDEARADLAAAQAAAREMAKVFGAIEKDQHESHFAATSGDTAACWMARAALRAYPEFAPDKDEEPAG